MYDDDQLEDYLAWTVAKRQPKQYQWMLDNWDIMQLTEAYAFCRIDHYLDHEDTEE